MDFVCGFGIRNGFKYLEHIGDKPMDFSGIFTKWIEQPLDHFDENETRKWTMRYAQNLEFYKPNGPLILYIGGEASIDGDLSYLKEGLVYELARETNGALVMSEHRYYGCSMPLDSSNTSNMKYLTSVQALADIAFLLKNLKSTLSAQNSSGTKVVVAGGSYPGNLAAWVRLLYSDLVDAAISASAPVLAKKKYSEYYEIVGKDYSKYGSQECYNKIAQIFKKYHELLSSTEGIEELKKRENICQNSDLTKLENQQRFLAVKRNFFGFQAQYATTETINNLCKNFSSDIYFENMHTQNEHCSELDFYKIYTDFNNYLDEKGWYYQKCNELGFFETSDAEDQPFTHDIPIDYYIKVCKTLFGPEFDENRIDEGVKATNARYGGQHPNVTNVVFVNGDMDPWHKLSVLEDLSADAPAIFIPKTSHCQILNPDKPKDPIELREARKKVKDLVKGWIGSRP